MQNKQQRRKRKRKASLNPRFDTSRLALEIGLIRLTLKDKKQRTEKKILKFK